LLSYEQSIRHAARIIAVGCEEYDALRRLYPEREAGIALIPNGVNMSLFSSGSGSRFKRDYGISPEARILLQVGSIYDCKNQLYSVKLFSKVLEREPNAFLVFIGHVFDTQYYHSLLKQIGLAALESRVLLIPGVSPKSRVLIDAYAAAHLLLLPSRSESHPLVLLEAWAAGVPALTSNLPSLHAAVIPGITGEFLPSDYDLDVGSDIAASMLRTKASYSPRLDDVVAKYSWDAIVSSIIEQYTEVLQDSKKLTDACRIDL